MFKHFELILLDKTCSQGVLLMYGMSHQSTRSTMRPAAKFKRFLSNFKLTSCSCVHLNNCSVLLTVLVMLLYFVLYGLWRYTFVCCSACLCLMKWNKNERKCFLSQLGKSTQLHRAFDDDDTTVPYSHTLRTDTQINPWSQFAGV